MQLIQVPLVQLPNTWINPQHVVRITDMNTHTEIHLLGHEKAVYAQEPYNQVVARVNAALGGPR